jgi:hypothetical protein
MFILDSTFVCHFTCSTDINYIGEVKPRNDCNNAVDGTEETSNPPSSAFMKQPHTTHGQPTPRNPTTRSCVPTTISRRVLSKFTGEPNTSLSLAPPPSASQIFGSSLPHPRRRRRIVKKRTTRFDCRAPFFSKRTQKLASFLDGF